MGWIFKYSIYLVVLLLANVSCQQEYIKPEKTDAFSEIANAGYKPKPPCPDYFYLYDQTKISLGQVNTAKIIIGFASGVTTAEKERLVSEYEFLTEIESSYNTGSADATIVSLKPGLSCAEVEAALNLLTKRGAVQYATPFFGSPFANNLLGITNQFILTLKPGFTAEDLQKLTKRTKTSIVEQLSDDTYIMSADKYATGNALQMAIEFAGFNPIATSEPDFLYAYE